MRVLAMPFAFAGKGSGRAEASAQAVAPECLWRRAPEVAYRPDGCSGIINIVLSSSKHPATLEQRVLDSLQSLKTDLDAHEATRLRDRAELRRRKIAIRPEAQVECMVRRTIDGASVDEMAPETVSRDELLAAARRYLPSHKAGYVRLALRGR